MICEFCDGQTIKKQVKRLHWLKGKLYLVEDVPAEVCRECGERYYHAKILDQIDNYLMAKHEVKRRLDVEVVAWPAHPTHPLPLAAF